MYSLNYLLVCAAGAAVLGLIIGSALGRSTSPQGKKQRDLESKLDQVLQEKKAYEADVVDHFADTARLLNKLTESYRDVHNHLANGASALCEDQGPVSLEKIRNNPIDGEIPAALAAVKPPLDYAPKTSPDDPGMLNEEFGLEKVAPEAAPEEAPTRA